MKFLSEAWRQTYTQNNPQVVEVIERKWTEDKKKEWRREGRKKEKGRRRGKERRFNGQKKFFSNMVKITSP